MDGGDLVAGQETGGVEIVDGQIPEEAAARPQEVDRRQHVAGDAAKHFHGADRASFDQVARSPIGGVEPPLEPDLKRHARGPHHVGRPPPTDDGVGDRLFGEDRLAGRRRLGDVRFVQARRRRDDDRIDVRLGQQRRQIIHEGTGLLAGGEQPLAVVGIDRGGDEPRPGDAASQLLGVKPADSPQPDDADAQRFRHRAFPSVHRDPDQRPPEPDCRPPGQRRIGERAMTRRRG